MKVSMCKYIGDMCHYVQNHVNEFQLLLNFLLFIVTTISVICAFKAYRSQKERAKKEAACKLANYYAHEILKSSSWITNVSSASGNFAYIKSIFDLNDFQEFTRVELIDLLKKKDLSLDDAKKKLNSPAPNIIFSCKLALEKDEAKRKDIITSYLTIDDAGKQKIVNEPLLQAQFRQEIDELLNEMEFFAMSCRYGVADEELLYQSLHQTFIANVWLLYFEIAYRNETSQNKFYTNIIWLFKKWYTREKEYAQVAKRLEEKANKDVQYAQQKLNEAKQKSEHVGAPVHAGKAIK